MGVRKRHNKWWVDFSFAGARYRKPSPENSRAGASAYEAVLKQRLARGEPADKPEIRKKGFQNFMSDWFQTYVKTNNKHSEIATKESILRVHLLPFFKRRDVGDITSLDIEKYKALKLEEGLNPKTINNHLAVLRTSLRCATEWHLIEASPAIKRLKPPPQKYDFLTIDECGHLIASAEGIWRDMIVVALETGLRFGELAALSWDNLDMQRKEMTIRQAFSRGVLGSPKNNRTRRIPMTNSVVEILEKTKQRRGYVFTMEGKPVRQVACIKKLHRICKKAGLRNIGWHVLRHTFASHLAQSGANLVAVQSLLGHSDIRTTMRYAHINDEVLRTAINVLNSCHNSVTADQIRLKKDGPLEGHDAQLSAQQNEKRTEVLFSKS